MAEEVNKQKTAMKSLKTLFKTFGEQMKKDPTPYECLLFFGLYLEMIKILKMQCRKFIIDFKSN